MKLYGAGNEIRLDGAKHIQREVNRENSNFEQDDDTVKALFDVMDENRDKRVTQEDIISLCRRYLSFESKYINYTPVVD